MVIAIRRLFRAPEHLPGQRHWAFYAIIALLLFSGVEGWIAIVCRIIASMLFLWRLVDYIGGFDDKMTTMSKKREEPE